MEPEIIHQSPVASVEPTPPTTPSPFTPKKPLKLLPILGGVAVILFSIALGIVFFGKDKSSTPATVSSDTPAANTDNYIKYANIPHFYTINLPPKWVIVETSPNQEQGVIIQTEGDALMEIKSFKAPTSNLSEYLTSLKDGRSASKTNSIKIGNYDAVEQIESWPKPGLEPVVTYTQIQDKIYVFTLLPASGKNAIISESLLRQYRSSLSTFALTSTAGLGVDWKEFITSKVDGVSYPSFAFTHPQSWAVEEQYEGKNLIISIYRNNYEIAITQAAVGNAVCLFKDSPSFQGSSGDLRNKEFTELTSTSGNIFRRYFNTNQGDKSTFFFCQKEANTPYFATPTVLGGIVYYVPAKYDQNIVKEMDEIVKTFSPK